MVARVRTSVITTGPRDAVRVFIHVPKRPPVAKKQLPALSHESGPGCSSGRDVVVALQAEVDERDVRAPYAAPPVVVLQQRVGRSVKMTRCSSEIKRLSSEIPLSSSGEGRRTHAPLRIYIVNTQWILRFINPRTYVRT